MGAGVIPDVGCHEYDASPLGDTGNGVYEYSASLADLYQLNGYGTGYLADLYLIGNYGSSYLADLYDIKDTWAAQVGDGYTIESTPAGGGIAPDVGCYEYGGLPLSGTPGGYIYGSALADLYGIGGWFNGHLADLYGIGGLGSGYLADLYVVYHSGYSFISDLYKVIAYGLAQVNDDYCVGTQSGWVSDSYQLLPETAPVYGISPKNLDGRVIIRQQNIRWR